MLRVLIELTGASYYKISQILLVDLFYLGFILTVARVERTGAWNNDSVN
jgi:hypothetical protein